MSFINYLLDIDLVINLFLIFSKKLSWKDALILTGVTTALYFIYLTYKNNQNESD